MGEIDVSEAYVRYQGSNCCCSLVTDTVLADAKILQTRVGIQSCRQVSDLPDTDSTAADVERYKGLVRLQRPCQLWQCLAI